MHLTKDGLRELLSKARNKLILENAEPATVLSQEEKETLKLYIPMQLGEESTKTMMAMVNDIREGKRAPLTDQERLDLNIRNMNESLDNFLSKLTVAPEEDLETLYDMCECIRASRFGK